MQNQQLKQENFEKQQINQVVQERRSRIFSADGILNSLSEFRYDPDNGMTFPPYFRVYKTIFFKKMSTLVQRRKSYIVTSKIEFSRKYKI